MKKYPKVRRPGHSSVESLFTADPHKLIITEKFDGCFPYSTRVQTNEGAIPIGKIVNQKMDVEVLSVNTESGETEYKPVTNWFKNGKTDNWIRINHDGESKSSHLTVTPNHEIYTPDGKVQAGDLQEGDELITAKPKANTEQFDLIFGSLLGDGSMRDIVDSKNPMFQCTHSNEQSEYAAFKEYILCDIAGKRHTSTGRYNQNSPETEKVHITSRSLPTLQQFDVLYDDSGKKQIADISVTASTPRTLAIWFCDDGSTAFSDTQRPRVTFHTQGFTQGECENLADLIELYTDDRPTVAERRGGYRLELGADSSHTLFERISSFVPPSMEYKLPEEFRTGDHEWGDEETEYDTVTVTEIEPDTPRNKARYDIEVDDNHNYVVKDILVSNSNFRFCRDGDQLRFGSRNTDLGTDVDEIGEMFDAVSDYIADTVDPDEIRELEERWSQNFSTEPEVTFTFFGENAVQHTIDEYDWDEVPQFQLFDVWVDYDGDEGEWLQWSTPEEYKEKYEDEGLLPDDDGLDFFYVEDIADWIGLETAPLVTETTVGEFLEEIDDYEVPESVYRSDGGPAEGVVIRNTATGTKAKYISDEFSERHKSVKQGDLVDPDDDNGALLSKHVTERRIEKNVQKLLEDPESDFDTVEMEMMPVLHEMLWRDVWAEDYGEIIFENWTIDLDQAHNKAANKAAEYLQDLIQSNTTPVTVVDPERGDVVGEEVDG